MKIAGFAAVAAATMALSGIAQAAPVSFSFTGHVQAGSIDTNALFGGGDLGGHAFTMSIAYDPAVLDSTMISSGCTVSGTPNCVYVDQATGGGAQNGWLYITPVLVESFSYSLTINGQTSTTVNNIPNGPGVTNYTNLTLSYNGADPPGPNGAYLSGQVYQQGGSGLNTSFLIYSSTVPYQNQISSQAYMSSFATDLCVGVAGNCRFFAGNDTITLIGNSAVPEPATWFSLTSALAGFGLLKLRKRRTE